MSTAMILAAGRGERMRPLTDHRPKCLLVAGGKSLIEWHIDALQRAGHRDLIINHAWLGQQIEAALGDGQRYGVRIRYSAEAQALETAGGIAQALTLMQDEVFLVVNGDIFTDFDFSSLGAIKARMESPSNSLRAHLVLVRNPDHNLKGDFALNGERVSLDDSPRHTFSGIGVYHRAMFESIPVGSRAPLAPLLKQCITSDSVTGHLHDGLWLDVGTPERLALADELARARSL